MLQLRACAARMTRHAPACFINELYYNNAVCLHSHFSQDFVMAQLPSANVDDVELRKKFGAMISSAILSDTSAAGSSSGAAPLSSSKGAPATKARADANVCLQYSHIVELHDSHFIVQVAEAFFANLDSYLGNKRT
jgi:hypothetical protein